MTPAHRVSLLTLSLFAALSLAACQREQASPEPTTPAASAEPTPEAPAAITLTDVVERDPRYLVGITYPPMVNKYPGLAREVKAYADAARADLDDALAEIGEDMREGMMYDLTLEFRELVDNERFAAVAANGGVFTGGAHANPLVGRWVWLPQRNEMLTATRLLPGADSWQDISDYVREQLLGALQQRVEADGLEPSVRAEVLRNGSAMIHEGTGPDVANFDEFEPVVGPDGRLIALRFVFPPYQVGPYSDGEQSVEVPAALLLPKVAPEYRDLFVGG